MPKKIMIKLGAYIVLVLGIIIFLALLLSGTVLLISYPDANLSKKMIMIGGILIVGTIVLLITISLFESLLEVLKLDEEITEIIDHEKENNYFMRKDV